MGVELLTEEQYRQLQQIEEFDLKTSSWLATPVEIRKLGGALLLIVVMAGSSFIIMEHSLIMLYVVFVVV